MEIERIRALAALMEETGLTALSLSEGADRLVLKKEAPPAAAAAVPAAPLPAARPREEAAGPVLNSPLVGCVYLSPAPGAAAFVNAGDAVKKGQVLCIIEAMKVMNEFTAPQSGVVAEVCVENGQLVEYAQPLFRLEA